MEPGSPNYVNQSDAFTTRPLNPSVHNMTLWKKCDSIAEKLNCDYLLLIERNVWARTGSPQSSILDNRLSSKEVGSSKDRFQALSFLIYSNHNAMSVQLRKNTGGSFSLSVKIINYQETTQITYIELNYNIAFKAGTMKFPNFHCNDFKCLNVVTLSIIVTTERVKSVGVQICQFRIWINETEKISLDLVVRAKLSDYGAPYSLFKMLQLGSNINT
ncbi:hypothetical protein P5673_014085 [Acropora cervicornis]|uniref:Uncharacterized protein n=1 Tax=Acropora cervicornis TaxID=6130 RepID=A0AAD9QJH5_ACRCE|nr:hypothetical protein P5673_014085 [Acropora cervicornis]